MKGEDSSLAIWLVLRRIVDGTFQLGPELFKKLVESLLGGPVWNAGGGFDMLGSRRRGKRDSTRVNTLRMLMETI